MTDFRIVRASNGCYAVERRDRSLLGFLFGCWWWQRPEPACLTREDARESRQRLEDREGGIGCGVVVE